MFVQGFPSRKRKVSNVILVGNHETSQGIRILTGGWVQPGNLGILTGPPDLTIQQAMGWMDMKRLRDMMKGNMFSNDDDLYHRHINTYIYIYTYLHIYIYTYIYIHQFLWFEFSTTCLDLFFKNIPQSCSHFLHLFPMAMAGHLLRCPGCCDAAWVACWLCRFGISTKARRVCKSLVDWRFLKSSYIALVSLLAYRLIAT